ncbi:hypothetical protein F4802DRAFT_322498 [Xylaria palmicola]|nr:hypothetical protein F4802DRAFT_322498 [Xylaria palmicola]
MATRRTRAASRHEESNEPQPSPTARQTRSTAKRASPKSKSTHQLESGIPQRGTRRRRRRSLESVATTDFPKSSAEQASPEQPLTELRESEGAEDVEDANVSHPESQDDSTYEDRAARLQDLLDFDLPKLCRWCERTYEALSALTHPEPTAEELKRLNTAGKFFQSARRRLAEDGAAYIDLSSSDLPYQDDPSAHITMQKVTHSANLISLLLSVAHLKRSTQAILSFLRELDHVFPTLFGSVPSARVENYDLAFHIRCRRLLGLLSEKPESEPLILATAIFCEEPAATPEEAARRLREGPFRKLDDGQDEGFTSSEAFGKQMDEIIAKLSLPERVNTAEFLDVAFPQDGLLEKLRAWALDMYVRVNKKAGKSILPPTDQNEGRAESEGLFVDGNDEAEEGSDSESSTQDEVYQQLAVQPGAPSFIQDQATLAAVRQSERGVSKPPRAPSPASQRNAKERLTDSQIADGMRQLTPGEVLWPSDRDEEAGNGIVALASRPARGSRSRSRSGSRELGAGKRKQSREDEDYVDENVDEDGDFEVNVQLIDESRRARQRETVVARAVANLAKLPRVAVNPSGRGGRQASPKDAPASSNLTLSQAARRNRLAHRARAFPHREKWSDADTELLLAFISEPEYGCSWAEMERQLKDWETEREDGKEAPPGFETPRNQQAMRDKARNLKKAYLCADSALPSGFDMVRLSQKERDHVIAAGRNPDRMEDDVDERGRVINNLLEWGSE